jgi:hypothetical protein
MAHPAAERRGVQRRRGALSAATPGWAPLNHRGSSVEIGRHLIISSVPCHKSTESVTDRNGQP